MSIPMTRRSVLGGLAAAPIVFSPATMAPASGSFARLWLNHPMGDDIGAGQRWPCASVLDIRCLSDPRNVTQDQCAIRLGISIARTFPHVKYADLPRLVTVGGINMAKRPLLCRDLTHAECGHNEDDLHVLRTTELASCLMLAASPAQRAAYPKFAWLEAPEVFERPSGKTSDFRHKLANRNGVLLIENFWDCRGGIYHGSHIDLWNGRLGLTKNELYYRGRRSPDLRYEELADRVVFWEVRADWSGPPTEVPLEVSGFGKHYAHQH